MELTKLYDGVRYEIVYGNYSGLEKRAVELVNSILLENLPYIPPLLREPTGKFVPVFVGTKSSNRFIAEKLSSVDLADDETYYKVTSEYIMISGGNAASVFYSACIFADDYLPRVTRRKVGHTFFVKPFIEELPEEEYRSRPKIKDRGLWTWGHVIYDYKSYIKNLARLKMNKITVWNDKVPLNASEVVDYAHSYGVKVFWGYSWGWDEKLDIRDESLMHRWGDIAVKVYSEGYADTGCDGIYFQMFTEQKTDTQDGVNIAEYAVKWTNYISSRLLEKYPDLKIEFGLHATSVKNHLGKIEKTDPRVAIIWEDCGSFPYHYDPLNTETYPETYAFSREIARLRDAKNMGVVLKGESCLDWTYFAHQTAPIIIGMNSDAEIEEKSLLRRRIFRAQESAWIKNGDKALEVINDLAAATNGNTSVSDLVEDGMFDRHIWLPTALFAELCWDENSDFQSILARVSNRPYINK